MTDAGDAGVALLSGRARRMLARGQRDPHPTDRAELAALLAREGAPPTEAFIAFAQHYGGTLYWVRGRDTSPQHPIELRLVWHDEVLADVLGAGDPHVYVAYMAPGLIQAWVWLDEEGTLYIDDFDAAGLPIRRPFASSIERVIESDALVDVLMDEQPEWLEVSLLDASRDVGWLDAHLGLPRILEASDGYTAWWGDAAMRVVSGSGGEVHAFTRTPDDADHLATLLAPPGPGSRCVVRTWPYPLQGR